MWGTWQFAEENIFTKEKSLFTRYTVPGVPPPRFFWDMHKLGIKNIKQRKNGFCAMRLPLIFFILINKIQVTTFIPSYF